MDDPREIPKQEPGESKRRYAARLNQIGIPCVCGCGQPISVWPQHIGRLPLYRRLCALKTPEYRAQKAAALKAQWQNPTYRAGQVERTTAFFHDPVIRAKSREASARVASDPANRRKHMKESVSSELLERYPTERPWIEANAADLDMDYSILPESYLDNQRIYYSTELRDTRPSGKLYDSDETKRGAFDLFFSDLHGRRAETLEACRL